VRNAVSKSERLVRARESIEVPPGGLRLVVVADTHSRPDPRRIPLIRAERPARILHAGDIGAPSVLGELEQIAPVTAVRGNIDAQMPGVPDVVTLDLRSGEAILVTLVLTHVAVYGPRLRADAVRLARAAGAQLIVCGHSHVPFLGRDQGIAVVNAGSIGPRRFRLPIVFAVVEVSRDGVSIHHVDCETGGRWLPPSAS
jgi:putative phosphoesterase